MTEFELDLKLAESSQPLGMLRICEVRIVNDARWQWLMLVPQIAAQTEIHDLSVDAQIEVALDAGDCGRALKEITSCTSINVASLGNVVRQLHIHVVARFDGDPNWPDPIWGFGNSESYEQKPLAELIAQLKEKLSF